MANESESNSATDGALGAGPTPVRPKAASREISIEVLAAWMALAPALMLGIIWLLSFFRR
jgi:hypothetical protein